MTPVIVVFNRPGLDVGRQLQGALQADLHVLAGRQIDGDVMFSDAGIHLRGLFVAGRPVIGICAAGILIRLLAPVLADKQDEPPVIAVSAAGDAVVPLLGGHHMGNELARKIAALLACQPAITCLLYTSDAADE